MEKAPKTVSVSAAESILVSNGTAANQNWLRSYEAYHGGMQTRIVRTDHGTYSAFCTDLGGETFTGEFCVIKEDAGHGVTLLHCGTTFAGAGVPVNIGQDLNGDVVVTVCEQERWSAFLFDRDTDEMTEYTVPAVYDFDGKHDWLPAYEATMFDFANRKLYAFFCGGSYTGNYQLEWTAFDLETHEWSKKAYCVWIGGIRRHCYLYPVPDGKGGAYILGERDDCVELEDEVWERGKYRWSGWLKDEQRLFHIPDLTSAENVAYTVVHSVGEYAALGHEGVWQVASANQCGGVFMDADGNLHVTYIFYLDDMASKHPGMDARQEYRHAVYRGPDCVFNETIDVLRRAPYDYSFVPNVVQASDGTLYLVVLRRERPQEQIMLYRAKDALGREWDPVKTITLPRGITAPSVSISEARSGSLTGDVVSCLFYCYRDDSGERSTVYTFELSLKDFTVTEPVDLLGALGLQYVHALQRRAYNASQQSKIVRTESGAYAAFTYNFLCKKPTFRYGEQVEQFQVAKFEEGGGTKILYSGEYTSMQDKYLTIRRLSDGKIRVSPPDGYVLYIIDPATDEVTEQKIEEEKVTTRLQTDVLTDETGVTYALFSAAGGPFRLSRNVFNAEGVLDSGNERAYTFDEEPTFAYDMPYTLYDGKGGVYVAAARKARRAAVYDWDTITDAEAGTAYLSMIRKPAKDDLAGKLRYVGRTAAIYDSLTLFYIPDLAGDAVRSVSIEPPYEDEGAEGIWSVADAANCGDVCLDADGKLHVFYTTYHCSFNDADRRANPALIAGTLRHMHTVYDGTALVSSEELGIAGLTKDSSVRMTQTADGTKYLLVCNIGEAGARIDVYAETADGWSLTAAQPIGDFTAESFSVSAPRGGSIEDGTVDCLVYGTDNDVYHVTVTFQK